jgi:hypothetical protein
MALAFVVPFLLALPDTGGVRLCAGGDVTLGSNLDTAWVVARRVPAAPDPRRLLAPLRPLVADADVVLVNVEGAIGVGPAPAKCQRRKRHCFAFRQPPEAAWALAELAPVVVGHVANNHAGDAGHEGWRQTQSWLRAAGVRVVGADTLPTLVALPTGDTLALLGFGTSGWGPDARDTLAVRRHVARAAARAPYVVVSAHLGAEGRGAQRTRDATERFLGRIDRGNPVAFARAAVAGGADLVVGHGPHVLRAAAWEGDALVLYSLGNLLTYGPFALAEPLNRGALACVRLGSGTVQEAWLRPTRQRPPGVAENDRQRRAWVLIDSLSRLDFPERGARVDSAGRLRRPAEERGYGSSSAGRRRAPSQR